VVAKKVDEPVDTANDVNGCLLELEVKGGDQLTAKFVDM